MIPLLHVKDAVLLGNDDPIARSCHPEHVSCRDAILSLYPAPQLLSLTIKVVITNYILLS